MKGFLNFIRSQGVVGLATGFILGGAVSKLVSSIVNDIINPLVGLALGRAGDLRSMGWHIGKTTISWGALLASTLDFIIIALVVYALIKVLRIDRLDIKKS